MATPQMLVRMAASLEELQLALAEGRALTERTTAAMATLDAAVKKGTQ